MAQHSTAWHCMPQNNTAWHSVAQHGHMKAKHETACMTRITLTSATAMLQKSQWIKLLAVTNVAAGLRLSAMQQRAGGPEMMAKQSPEDDA